MANHMLQTHRTDAINDDNVINDVKQIWSNFMIRIIIQL